MMIQTRQPDGTSPAQPKPPLASSPDIPGDILASATQDVPGHADFASSYGAPCNTKTHPDPEGDIHASESDSDAPPPL